MAAEWAALVTEEMILEDAMTRWGGGGRDESVVGHLNGMPATFIPSRLGMSTRDVTVYSAHRARRVS